MSLESRSRHCHATFKINNKKHTHKWGDICAMDKFEIDADTNCSFRLNWGFEEEDLGK